jgi:hypothetical protein
MAKVVAVYGDMVAYRVKPSVLAIYVGARFAYNLRPADAGYKCPEMHLKERIRCRAGAKIVRAELVKLGRQRKAAARAAIAAAASVQPSLF